MTGVFAGWEPDESRDSCRVLREARGEIPPGLLSQVCRSVEWFVELGLAHRELKSVEAIGVDEIHCGRGLRADNFLTVIYQIDTPGRRQIGRAHV